MNNSVKRQTKEKACFDKINARSLALMWNRMGYYFIAIRKFTYFKAIVKFTTKLAVICVLKVPYFFVNILI